MDDKALENLRYPIGTYDPPSKLSDRLIAQWVDQLEEFPKNISRLVSSLSREQLDTPYRPEGWTVRQVVHHLADSHHNAYLRFKWALTEESPEIKAYDEKGWAELPDARQGPIALPLDHLDAVHARLVYLLRNLTPAQLSRKYTHPVKDQVLTLKETIGQYVWHGNHHYTHIRNLMVREGWTSG